MKEKIYVPAGEGKSYDVIGGDHVVIKATGEQTGGMATILETTVPAGGGPPRHLHERESETFYVLEGEFEFEIDGDKYNLKQGDFFAAPANVPHQFRNTATSPSKLLVVCQPAGFENFIEAFAQIPLDAAPDPAKMAELGAQFGVQFLPPSE